VPLRRFRPVARAPPAPEGSAPPPTGQRSRSAHSRPVRNPPAAFLEVSEPQGEGAAYAVQSAAIPRRVGVHAKGNELVVGGTYRGFVAEGGQALIQPGDGAQLAASPPLSRENLANSRFHSWSPFLAPFSSPAL